MLKRLSVFVLGFAFAALAHAQGTAPEWVAGKNYFPVEPPQPTTTGDKIEVVEVFSYACPACFRFYPTVDKLKAALPPNVQLVYVPAAFRPDEDWVPFQRAFLASQALGLVDKTHDALFRAVWDNGPLAVYDPKTQKPLKPTIEDIADFYAKYGVSKDQFLGVANSFAINAKMKNADAYIKATGIDGTPSLVVNGKYRITVTSAGGEDKVIPLVLYLVQKETSGQ